MASSPPSAVRVGVAGLGIIGRRVAETLAAKGFAVKTWNRTPQPETAGWTDTPLALAEASDVIQIFVTDGPALLAVLKAMAPALTKGKLVINSATISLRDTGTAAAAVAKTGADFLDAPFTGSRDASAAGQLVYYAGGEPAILEKARPVLEASSKAILVTGAVGSATVLKIATNMISATTVQVLSEALGVVASAGVPLEKLMEAMELNASGSGLTRMKLPGMIAGDFTPHFSLKNMLKDSELALELAGRAGMELPALTAASECMAGLKAAGRGDEDYSVLATNFIPREPA